MCSRSPVRSSSGSDATNGNVPYVLTIIEQSDCVINEKDPEIAITGQAVSILRSRPLSFQWWKRTAMGVKRSLRRAPIVSALLYQRGTRGLVDSENTYTSTRSIREGASERLRSLPHAKVSPAPLRAFTQVGRCVSCRQEKRSHNCCEEKILGALTSRQKSHEQEGKHQADPYYSQNNNDPN